MKMRIEELDQISIVRTVRYRLVREQFLSPFVNIHHNGLTERVVVTPFGEHVVETVVQCFRILVCVKHMLFERVEKMLMGGIGANVEHSTNIFQIVIVTELEWDIGIHPLQG